MLWRLLLFGVRALHDMTLVELDEFQAQRALLFAVIILLLLFDVLLLIVRCSTVPAPEGAG